MGILIATIGATQVVFSDVNPDVNVQNNFELVYNEDSINKSIATILSTRKKTRPFNRTFGSYIMDLLFDPVDASTASSIRQEIISAIREWETRIILTKSEVLPDYAQQAYFVSLDYTIPALVNKSANFSFNLATGQQ